MALSPTTSRGSGSAAGVTVDSYVAVTTGVNVSGSFGTPTTVVTAAAITADGTTVYKIEYFCPYLGAATATQITIDLFDGATNVGVLMTVGPTAAAQTGPVSSTVYLTPSAGSHTYSVRSGKSGGAVSMNAGAGTGGADWPLFIRISHGS